MLEELPPEIERVIREASLDDARRILQVFTQRVAKRIADEDPKGIALAVLKRNSAS